MMRSRRPLWKYPANGLHDAQPKAIVEIFVKLHGLFDQSGPQVSGLFVDPCLSFVIRKQGGAVGAVASHIDDILGRGGRMRYPRRAFS